MQLEGKTNKQTCQYIYKFSVLDCQAKPLASITFESSYQLDLSSDNLDKIGKKGGLFLDVKVDEKGFRIKTYKDLIELEDSLAKSYNFNVRVEGATVTQEHCTWDSTPEQCFKRWLINIGSSFRQTEDSMAFTRIHSTIVYALLNAAMHRTE